MRVIEKKKIYRGMVELRDYELKKLLELKKPVKIRVGDEYMILRYIDLKTKGKITNTQYSIINEGQKYKLIGFEWKPTKDIDTEAINLVNTFVNMPEHIRQDIRRKLGLA
jgi:hypothetical protein